MSARAIITRCDCPPEKKSGFDSARSSEPELLEQLVRARLSHLRRDAVVGGVEDQVVADRERAVEIAPLRHDRELASRADRDRPTTSTPSTDAVPLVGRTRVVSTPTVVVFPAPFGPSRPKTSPASTPKLTPSTALTGDFG